MQFDVAIIGGGPGGSTVGTLLRKYNPNLRVGIFEREFFPREHVGESQLPEVSRILDEMGCWDKVEAAGFPIKIGATYRWGTTDDLWNFEFLPAGRFHDEARPAKFEGQRQETAFQVDRAIYDKILLDHAEELGCEVRQGVKVTEIHRDGDAVTGFALSTGEEITAKYYIDASGHTGVLRRAMGVEVDAPTRLQNIAIWDYWTNAEWAVHIGVGGTRVQVMSLGYGWIWFIPLGPDRTSVGLVVPAEYYKESKLRPQELYDRALSEEPRIRDLMRNAKSEGKLATTKDWSFVSKRMAGENWFLVGESCGFADPILAAGMTLAHTGARECAYSLLELFRGNFEPEWLRERYEETQLLRIGQHIRFADYWYSTNAHFTDLKEFCAEIASDAGLSLNADDAFRWLGTGGFAVDTVAGNAGIGTLSIESLKQVLQRLSASTANWTISGCNVFKLDFEGAERGYSASLENGAILRDACYRRDGNILPHAGLFGLWIEILSESQDLDGIVLLLERFFNDNPWLPTMVDNMRYAFHVLESMAANGWVKASVNPMRKPLRLSTPDESDCIHVNQDPVPALKL